MTEILSYALRIPSFVSTKGYSQPTHASLTLCSTCLS
jgi:hypothetical protein